MVGKRLRSYLRTHLPHRSAAPRETLPDPPDTSAATFSYSHVPLPSAATHIRLLDILPAPTAAADASASPDVPSDAPLQCRLFTFPLNKLPAYLAISYTWGTGAATHPLHVVLDDAAGSSGPLRITESLAEALRHLRELAEGAFLWVDQICIDQGNVPEKNAQVAIMQDIYRCAMSVFVWLGPASDGLDVFVERMRAVYQVAVDEGIEAAINGDDPEMKGHVDGWSSAYPRPEHSTAQEVFADKIARALFGEGSDDEVLAFVRGRRAWFSRPWFSRVWVIQEFALAKRAIFVCGMKGIESGAFGVAQYAFTLASNLLFNMMSRAGVDFRVDGGDFGRGDPTNSLLRSRKDWEDESAEIPLLLAVKRLYGESRPPIFATDARDRIFALLGLASDVDRLGIRPDYSEGMTADVVYTRAARAMIKSTASGLSLLEMVRFPKSLADGETAAARLPSWVPDFVQFSDPIVPLGDEWVYSPTGDAREPCFLSTPDERILGLKGILVDHVLLIDEAWDNDIPIVHKYHGYFLGILRLLAAAGPPASGQSDNHSNGDHSDGDRSNGDHRNDDHRNDDHSNDGTNNNNNPNTTITTITTTTDPDHLTAACRIMTGDIDDYTGSCIHPLGPAELSKMRDLLELSEIDNLLPLPRQPDGSHSDRALALRARQRALADAPATMQPANRLRIMDHRRPYRTAVRGCVGMGPRGMRPGDMVAIFPGAQTPFVLRPREDRGAGCYELVGETYCHGVMDGEAWVGEAELKDFFLV